MFYIVRFLHGYEINTIQGILSGFDFNISCFDDEQIDIELQKRRGKGGVITIWPQKFSHKIEKLEKEERFVVIEVLADKHKMILINKALSLVFVQILFYFLLKVVWRFSLKARSL
jgi:hypothetical protein